MNNLNYLTNYCSRKKAHLVESKTEEWDGNKKFNLSDLQQYILVLQNDGWEEIEFDYDEDTGYIVSFLKTREETDEEYNDRMKILDGCEKKRKSEKLKKEEQERKEYERLKKKFEK